MNPLHAKRFVLIFLSLIGLPILFIIAFNGIIDPFDIFSPFKWEGINLIKTKLDTQQRLHKALEIAKQKPQVIFLGSSRVAFGLDPDYLMAVGYQNVFNAGFAGASLDEIYYFLEHAFYYQPALKVAIVGIDFFAFNKTQHVTLDFPACYLKENLLCLTQKLPFLLTKKCTVNSYKTWQENANRTGKPAFFSNGSYNPVRVTTPENTYFNKDIDFVCMIFKSPTFYLNYEYDKNKIKVFEKIVAFCQAKNITLKVLINPASAFYWEALHRNQLGPVIEQIKRDLSAIYPVWDFSGFNSITTQAYATKDTPFYYECSHYKKLTGNLILDKLFGLGDTSPDFGFLLTLETLEKALSTMRQQRKDWLATSPSLLEELDKVFPPRAL